MSGDKAAARSLSAVISSSSPTAAGRRRCFAVEVGLLVRLSMAFSCYMCCRLARLPDSRGMSVLEVVNDDMPFLVDSVVGELNSRGLEIRLFVHPVFLVERDAAGRLVGFEQEHAVAARRESFIHFHVEGVDGASQ